MSMYSDTNVSICQANNGFSVTVRQPVTSDGPSRPGDNEQTYVYADIKELLAALPVLFKQMDSKKVPPVKNEKDLMAMENDINENNPPEEE